MTTSTGPCLTTVHSSLQPDQVYAVIAYLLHLNGIVVVDAVLDAETLSKVLIPNRAGFIADSRPDTSNVRCRVDCK